MRVRIELEAGITTSLMLVSAGFVPFWGGLAGAVVNRGWSEQGRRDCFEKGSVLHV